MSDKSTIATESRLTGSHLKTKEGVLEWAVYAADDFLGNRRIEFSHDDLVIAQRIADAVKLAEDPRTKKALRLLEAWGEWQNTFRPLTTLAEYSCPDEAIRRIRAALDEPEGA